MLPYVPGNTACVSMATSSHVLNLSASTYDILNYKAFACTAASLDMSEICQNLGSCRQLKLGKGDGLRYSLYLLLVYKGSSLGSHWAQAMGHRFLLPAPRSTTNSKSGFSPRTVCQWVLCLILGTVCFWAVWLFSGAPASLFCVQQSCSWPWTRTGFGQWCTPDLSLLLWYFSF